MAVIKQLVAADSKIPCICFLKFWKRGIACRLQHICESIDAVITIDADLQHPIFPYSYTHATGNRVDVVYTL
jgi:hypothetical protein